MDALEPPLPGGGLLFAMPGPGFLVGSVLGGLLAAVLGIVAGSVIGALRGGKTAKAVGGGSGAFLGFLVYRFYQLLWPSVWRYGEYGSYKEVQDPLFPYSPIAIVGGATVLMIVRSSRLVRGRSGAAGGDFLGESAEMTEVEVPKSKERRADGRKGLFGPEGSSHAKAPEDDAAAG